MTTSDGLIGSGTPCFYCGHYYQQHSPECFWNVENKKYLDILSAKNTVLPEPAPKPSQGDVWELVIKDMKDRRQFGIDKYGTPLQANNGRKTLVDAYQEALDLCVYLRQEIEERNDSQG